MDPILGTFLVFVGFFAISWVIDRATGGEGFSIGVRSGTIDDVEEFVRWGPIIIAGILLLAAIGWPGYIFETVYTRVAITFIASFLIYQILRYHFRPSLLLIGLVITLILFNPFKIVTMDRSMWIIVDILVALTLPTLGYFYNNYHNKREDKIADERARRQS